MWCTMLAYTTKLKITFNLCVLNWAVVVVAFINYLAIYSINAHDFIFIDITIESSERLNKQISAFFAHTLHFYFSNAINLLSENALAGSHDIFFYITALNDISHFTIKKREKFQWRRWCECIQAKS